MRSRWVAVARGDVPADLVLAGGSVLSVFTGEVFRADVAIADGHIVGVGEYDGPVTYDASGTTIIPGFIDGHCHIESSKLRVDEFARLVLPRGTTSVVVDPHELANVLGTDGIEYLLAASEGLPLTVFVKLPSCVPASALETPAGNIEAADLAPFINHPRVVGLAEMMDYPAAIAGRTGVMDKLALTGYRHIDGHAPGLSGRDLNAYLVAGPSSDHECTSLEEALEKRRLGMWIMIREASMIRNLLDLLPLIRRYGTENCMFVTDDREAGTLLAEGHINSMVRLAVRNGVTPGEAVGLATINVARYHSLPDLGAVAPGYLADLLLLPNLEEFEPMAVFKSGRLVAERGEVQAFAVPAVTTRVTDTIRIRGVSASDFRIPAENTTSVNVVKLIPDQVVTAAIRIDAPRSGNQIVADAEKDVAKLAVVERHHASGRIGLGLVQGFGLRRGAFASTVAHDAHNIVVVGMDDDDMASCISRLAAIGGGLVVMAGGELLGELPLEIAGLMSTLPGREVAERIGHLETLLTTLGVSIGTPFMYLSFLALSVIPEIRVTDQGIVDVRRFEVIPLGVT